MPPPLEPSSPQTQPPAPLSAPLTPQNPPHPRSDSDLRSPGVMSNTPIIHYGKSKKDYGITVDVNVGGVNLNDDIDNESDGKSDDRPMSSSPVQSSVLRHSSVVVNDDAGGNEKNYTPTTVIYSNDHSNHDNNTTANGNAKANGNANAVPDNTSSIPDFVTQTDASGVSVKPVVVNVQQNDNTNTNAKPQHHHQQKHKHPHSQPKRKPSLWKSIFSCCNSTSTTPPSSHVTVTKEFIPPTPSPTKNTSAHMNNNVNNPVVPLPPLTSSKRNSTNLKGLHNDNDSSSPNTNTSTSLVHRLKNEFINITRTSSTESLSGSVDTSPQSAPNLKKNTFYNNKKFEQSSSSSLSSSSFSSSTRSLTTSNAQMNQTSENNEYNDVFYRVTGTYMTNLMSGRGGLDGGSVLGPGGVEFDLDLFRTSSSCNSGDASVCRKSGGDTGSVGESESDEREKDKRKSTVTAIPPTPSPPPPQNSTPTIPPTPIAAAAETSIQPSSLASSSPSFITQVTTSTPTNAATAPAATPSKKRFSVRDLLPILTPPRPPSTTISADSTPTNAFANINGDTSLTHKITPLKKLKKTLILDLDETLVHSSFRPPPLHATQPSFILPITIDNVTHLVYVLKRPGVDEFLKMVKEVYEVIVYTASLDKYGNPLLDLLELSSGIKFDGRLFRPDCVFYNGSYVKDLSLLNRCLTQTIIIDNSTNSYIFHEENAIDCGSFIDDLNDRELDAIGGFLGSVWNVGDVRGLMGGWRDFL